MVNMKKIVPSLAILAAVILFTLPFSERAAAQSQGARAEYYKPVSKKVQRRDYRYVDASCHTFGGYGWGPYFGPCPYRGEVYAAQPGPPVFGPFMPFGPFW
jgi:hypothetical protein